MDVDKNFKISFPNSYCLEYSEGEKRIKLEVDFRERFQIIDKDDFKKWIVPYDNISLSDEKQEEIFLRIKNFLLDYFGHMKIYVSINTVSDDKQSKDFINNNDFEFIVSSVKYVDGWKSMDIKFQISDDTIYFDKDCIKNWNNPYDDMPLTEEKREEIFQRVQDYLLKECSTKKIYVTAN